MLNSELAEAINKTWHMLSLTAPDTDAHIALSGHLEGLLQVQAARAKLSSAGWEPWVNDLDRSQP